MKKEEKNGKRAKLPKCGERDFAPDWWKRECDQCSALCDKAPSGVEE